MSAGFGDSLQLLRENPDLAKAILSAGLLVAALMSGGPLVLSEVKSDVWGIHMSSYSATVSTATGVVSIVFGGWFGRLSDKMERRAAMALVGLLNFMPWYFLLALGANRRGLLAHCAVQIVGGVTCMTATGCPMMFTLANDVMPADNRELAFGISYSGVFVCAMVSAVMAIVIARLNPGDPVPVLCFIVMLSIGFFITLWTIRLPHAARGPSREGEEQAEEADGSVNSSSEDGEGSPAKKPQTGCSIFAPFRLACEYAPLRNLCFVAGLLCLPEIVLGDVTQQFIYAELDLIGAKNASRKQLASLLSVYPGLLATLPAYYISGVVGRRIGALRLMKLMIPPSALLMTMPVLLVVITHLWFVPIMAILLALSGVIFTPLQTVNAQIAPPDRVGEAMAAVGVSKQVSSVCGNILVSFGVPALRGLNVWRPLRFFYPLAGVLALSALAFAAQIRPEDVPKAKSTRDVEDCNGMSPSTDEGDSTVSTEDENNAVEERGEV